jgi:hypothetical protein
VASSRYSRPPANLPEDAGPGDPCNNVRRRQGFRASSRHRPG